MRAGPRVPDTSIPVSDTTPQQTASGVPPTPEEAQALEALRSITPEDTAIRRRAVTALLRSLLASKRTLGR
jgi:hypothetical protein